MNYGAIKYCDIANGAGVRTSLFVTGCRLHCPGCFNAEVQDFAAGEPYTREVEDAIVESLRPAWVQGLSLLGGDPMEPENQACLVGLVERVALELPEKDVWCYTGYLLDRDLVSGGRRWVAGVTERLLDGIDVLVDGPFVLAEKDITLRFKGSANQRVIDLAATRAASTAEHPYTTIVSWADDEVFATHTM